jgi:hypothetical protein
MEYSNEIDINKLTIKSIKIVNGETFRYGQCIGYTTIIRKILPHCDAVGRIDRYILLSDCDELIGSIESTAVVFVEYTEGRINEI